MRYKATFTIGLAAGYVLGSRAGRQRYEQIKRMSRTVARNPAVKRTTDLVQAQAMHLAGQARQSMQTKAGAVGHDLLGKVGAHDLMSKVSGKVGQRFGNHVINLDAEHSYANGTMT
jgi:hypothetical protein